MPQDEVVDKEMEEMSRAGVYFGYSRGRRHPGMSPFVFGIHNNVEIFNIASIREKLKQAQEFVKSLGEEKKTILFVATKPAGREIVKKAAETIKMPYVTERWLGGTLTNFKAIRGRVDYFLELENKKKSEGFENLSKKERLKIGKELASLERNFKGLERLNNLPSGLIVVDPKEENTAVREAIRKNIPVVAVLNTDCDPAGIVYPIPANDAAVSSINYLINKLVEVYEHNREN